MHDYRKSLPADAQGKISDQIKGQLTTAKGWLFNPEGQWISRQNKIPSYIENKYKLTIDYEDNGLGIDNFIFYQLREITIEDSTYIILIKKYKDGEYKFPTIKKNWINYNSVIFYVFSKYDINRFKTSVNDSINFIQIKIIYCDVIKRLTNENYISEIQKEMIKLIDGKKSDYLTSTTLYFHFKPSKKKNIVRFQIYSGSRDSDQIECIIKEHKITDSTSDWEGKQIYFRHYLLKCVN